MLRREMNKFWLYILSVFGIVVLLVALIVGFYLKGLPYIVSNGNFINYVEKVVSEQTGAEFDIEKPVLKTGLTPDISFKVEKVSLKYKKSNLLDIENFDMKFSFSEIFRKKLIINKVVLESLYADVNKILELPVLKQEKKEQKKSDFTVDIFHSVMAVKNAVIIYKLDKDTNIQIEAENLGIDDNTDKKYVNYHVIVDITKGKEKLHITASDDDNVYIENQEKLVINNSAVTINKSKILISGSLDSKANYNFNVSSKKFTVAEVLYLLNSQIIANNIPELLVYFKDINGNFDFNFNISNNDMKGDVVLNKLAFKLVPFADLPVLLNNGKVSMDMNTVMLKDFSGYYDNKSYNKMNFEGSVKDYMKSIDTDLKGRAVVTNDFAKKYLSKMLSYPIEIKGNADTMVSLKYKYNKIDLKWLYIFKQGSGFIIDGESDEMMTEKTGRALTANIHFEDMLLNIKSINYYIGTPSMDRDYVRVPIVSMKGNIDLADGKTFVKDFGLELPKPMPSGFLNLLMKQKFFKNGKFTGRIHVVNTGKYPVLDADLNADKVAIPSLRLFINKGQFKTEKNLMRITSDGRYRRSGYDFSGAILNEIKFPIVVKDVHLIVDKVDVERYLRIFNNQKPSEQAAANVDEVLAKSAKVEGDEDTDDDVQTFDLANLIIEKCVLVAKEGFYKDIKFSDVAAVLTLDKNSLLKITSNKFNIAEGTSSAKIECDLRKHKYSVLLGAKDVNSDIMATSLLNLPNEIDGKASGIIDLNTDDSLKLNGKILFKVNDGIIAKVGLVEYVMKVAALFRNPLTMISPSVISDLVNIPEGRFDKIDGHIVLKNNVVERMMIKSSAPELSSFIVGRYDLENKDASLRIYTKFANRGRGALGFLRNISLNSLANRIPLSSRNDSNYYASEISQLPPIDADEKDCQIFLTKVDGDVERNNFISSLKKIK